jgi:hypothetical protein
MLHTVFDLNVSAICKYEWQNVNECLWNCYTVSVLQTMLFYRNAESLSNSGPRLSGPSGAVWPRETEDALRRMWMLKCLLMGVALMGISYYVVHISGMYERSLTLTVFTFLTFLLIYILWCSQQKQHHLTQVCSIVNINSPRYAVLWASPNLDVVGFQTSCLKVRLPLLLFKTPQKHIGAVEVMIHAFWTSLPRKLMNSLNIHPLCFKVMFFFWYMSRRLTEASAVDRNPVIRFVMTHIAHWICSTEVSSIGLSGKLINIF